MMKSLLAHPLTRGLDVDDPRTTHLRRRIVREKSFLRQIYEEWYAALSAALPTVEGVVLELGSGAGFLKDVLPCVLTSEVFHCPGVDIVLDGLALPLADGAVRAIVMTDVLHHLSRPRQFFVEATRCVRPGGAVIMIEPWVTAWSQLIYAHLHHEPFNPAAEWEFPSHGPLSGANGALPWILFERDRIQFEHEFPQWRVCAIRPMMPFRYLVSGGVSLRSLMPGFTFGLWRWMENGLNTWRDRLAMFAQIELRRTD